MQGLFRRLFFAFLTIICFLGAGTSLKAYPVAITINVTFVDLPGGSDPVGFGTLTPNTATISTTVESSAPAASYPATVLLSVPGLGILNRSESGSLTIATNGQIGASFSDAQGSFSAVLALNGLSFPIPVPASFGTASFSSPASTVTYDLLGAQGKVGVTGTVMAEGLSASPSTPINVSYQLGGSAPAPHTISISSNTPTGYTVSVLPGSSNSSTGFLTLSTSAGTTPGSVVASFSTAVTPGTYTAEIAINTSSDSTGAPITIPVTYTVTQPVETGSFNAAPSSLAFSYTVGGALPPAQTIALTSSATPPPSFTAASSVPWATVTSSSGTTPSMLTVSVNPASLAAGSYSGAINISSSAGNLSIPIGITVNSAGGSGGGTSGFTVSPGILSFTFFVPTSTSQSQTVQVTSSTGAATYTAAVASGSFLSVSPASGLIPGSVVVTASNNGLSTGTFSGSILFTSPGQPNITLPVTVSNGSSSAPDTIVLSPKALTINYVLGGTVPAPTVVQVTDSSPVSFTVTSSSFYLPVSPVSGVTPGSFTVTLNPVGLMAGVYHDTIAVGPSLGFGAALSVTLNATSPVVTPPTLTPASLTFVSPATASSPLTQTVTISENATTTFAITVPWLSATTASSGSNTVLTVIANPAGLAPGTYTTAIAITAPAALSIPVTLTVAAPASPILTAVPASVAFAYQIGGTAPPTQTVALSGSPTGPYTVTGYGAWLAVVVSPDSGTATLSVNTAGLSPGVYVTALKISGAGFSNSPLFVPVTLTVSASPTFGVSPTALTFNYIPGEAAPAPQTVAVASSTGASFTSATADSPWIAVASTVNPSGPSDALTVSVTPGSMANGTYHGNITIAGAGITATIPVTLNIDAVAIPVLSAVTNGISFDNNVGAPGLIVSLWGTGLGPAVSSPLELANATSVSATNAGTQVFANGIPCPILFSSAQQVNAILPFSLQGSTSTQVTLSFNGVMSNAVTVPLQPAAPSLFSANATGQGEGAILNQDLSVNSASNPASAGSIIAIYGGGGGATNPPGVDGLLVPLTTPFPSPVLSGSISIGGQSADLVYYGDAPGLVSGVLQINAVIPAGTASGAQLVVVTVGTFSSQPNITVYVK